MLSHSDPVGIGLAAGEIAIAKVGDGCVEAELVTRCTISFSAMTGSTGLLVDELAVRFGSGLR